MFVGAINSQVRAFLASISPALEGRTIVVGCSGNFTSESVLSATAKDASIYSNDIALYSCAAAAYLLNRDMRLEIAKDDYAWLAPHLKTPGSKLATIMVLLDMLEFEKRNNPHRQRMWDIYMRAFPSLVVSTLEKIAAVDIKINGYFAGDVWEHFQQHDHQDATFMCYAPTYTGGYERLYKSLDAIFHWDRPTYQMLDEKRRNGLLDWMRQRSYVWYDDRVIPDMKPVMIQKAGRAKTVYIYSNLEVEPKLAFDQIQTELPKLPLIKADTVITERSDIWLQQIKTTDLAKFKHAYLGKNILFGSGGWAFAIFIDGRVIGFVEFSSGKYGRTEMYLNSDFCISGSQYERLSKLPPMIAMSGETKRMIERIILLRVHTLTTTAFTNKPVSMKYRGVFNLDKRGETPDGQKFINYSAQFNNLSWKETLCQWLTKHGSTKPSTN